MKLSITSASVLLGIFAAAASAQTTDAALPQTTAVVAPLMADDGASVAADPFPVPVEMAKRDLAPKSLAERLTSSLTKRHYGTFTCSASLNAYCYQFLGQEGVGNLVGCAGGTCYVGCGVSGYSRTNDASQICVNYSTDENNCGSYGTTCPSVANGTPLCNGGPCTATCASGYTLSGGKCINTQNDPANCGNAGTVCPAVTNGTPTCSGGSCSAACNNGFTLASGKCVNTNNDVNNCGGAGKTCAAVANGTPICSGGSCSATCANGYTLSSGKCVNTANDVNNCGTAGTVCPAVANGTPICSAGSCSATCAATYTLVAGKCVNTNTDVNNCGGSGVSCASRAGTGYVAGSARCNNGACTVSCTTGYTSTNGVCTNAYLADPANCGTSGNNCAANAGTGYLAGSAACNAGVCSVSCQTGYSSSDGRTCTQTCKDGSVLVNGKCGRITGCTTNQDCITQTGSATSYCYLSSDGNACFAGSSNANGSPTGAACGWSSNAAGDDNGCATGLVCLNHVCTPTTTNDPNNCGRTGNVCPTPANGSRTCQAGSCGITCNTGYTASGTTCVNTNNDNANCGTVGTKCAATGTGVSGSTCVAGKCQATCSSGYTLSADKASCTSICADGSTYNGSTCSRYQCTTNAQCQSLTSRTDSACFLNQCYTSSSNTGGLREGSSCGTAAVSPGDDNQCAAGLVCVYYTCYNANNPSACGASRTACPTPANAVATCTVGTCGFTCKTGYMLNTAGSACVLNPSVKTKKKRGLAGPELCPKGETACPIAGSASFGAFVNSSDRVKDFAHSLGGYECIDTGSDLQSCGGCASLGTGYDCTRIAHAAEVGCSNGKCVIFGCRKGYVPALDAEKCIKVEDTHKQRSSHIRQRAMRRKDISH